MHTTLEPRHPIGDQAPAFLARVALLAASGVLLVACSGDTADAGISTLKPTATATSPMEGSGPTASRADTEPLVGTWRNPSNGRHITYTTDGRFSVKEDRAVLAQGTYTATATTIEIVPAAGAIACDATGAYDWDVEDETLLLTVVRDECSGRKMGLDGARLERVD